MRCQECREALGAFVEDSREFSGRGDLAQHLAECEDCARFLENESFWDQSIAKLIRREASPELRESILAAAGLSGPASAESPPSRSPHWRDRFRFFWWAGTRDMSWRTWVEAFAWVALVMLLLFALRWWRG